MRWVFLVLGWLLVPVLTHAQVTAKPAPPRGDVAVSLGWLHLPFEFTTQNPYPHDDWTHHATARASAGFHWNNHWKTEASLSFSNTAGAWDAEIVNVGDEVTHRSIDHGVRYTHVSLGQLYQFGRNEWVHPFAGAGVLLQARSGTSHYSSAVIYRRPTGVPTMVREPEQRDLEARTLVTPFVTAGLKAYMTPRAFFRTDLQVALSRGTENVVLHAGFGVDF